MRRKLFYIFICLAFLTLPVYATIEIQSRQLTTGDGISNNSIRYLLQDSKGFIWMSSLNGLNRYDGNSFISFFPNAEKISLADHRIAKLYEDRNGLLWITTTLNLMSCYDLKKDCFVDFTGCGEYNQNYRDCLEASDGSIWLWNDGNGCRKVSYKNGSFSSMVYKEELGNIFTNQILYVYEDSRQRIWAGTSEGLASYFAQGFNGSTFQGNEVKTQGYRWFFGGDGACKNRNDCWVKIYDSNGMSATIPLTLKDGQIIPFPEQ